MSTRFADAPARRGTARLVQLPSESRHSRHVVWRRPRKQPLRPSSPGLTGTMLRNMHGAFDGAAGTRNSRHAEPLHRAAVSRSRRALSTTPPPTHTSRPDTATESGSPFRPNRGAAPRAATGCRSTAPARSGQARARSTSSGPPTRSSPRCRRAHPAMPPTPACPAAAASPRAGGLVLATLQQILSVVHVRGGTRRQRQFARIAPKQGATGQRQVPWVVVN